MPQKFYSIKEVCELLGNISRCTLWRMEKKGWITSFPIGNRRVFCEAEIQRCMARIEAGGAIVLTIDAEYARPESRVH